MVLTLTSDGRISEITPFRSLELFSSFGLPRAMDPEGSSDLYFKKGQRHGAQGNERGIR
jgi:hypothetical protein